MTLGNAPVAREGFSPAPGGARRELLAAAKSGRPAAGASPEDLAADPSGWYARIGTKAIRAYNHTAAPVRGS
ncbi:hypothetical protein [Streptomyces anulatus]|uniref:hypothetical protein n=1 Tax=Streptomyces anulatus TaxID=1892 RepID=UPI0036ADCF27